MSTLTSTSLSSLSHSLSMSLSFSALLEIPSTVQQLLKLCAGEGSDDHEEALTQLLHGISLSPAATNTIVESEQKTQAQSSEAVATGGAEAEGEMKEEIPVNQKEDPLCRVLSDTWNGETVLHVAAASGSSNLIPILLLHGANPSIK